MAHPDARSTDDLIDRASVWVGVVVLCLFCSTYLLNPRFISHETDWLQYPARYRFARECWLAGAPPLWCQYFGGGYFIAGDPDGQTLTLLTPFVLIFGEIVGLKLALIAAHFVAASGMYYLMRRVWRVPRLAAVYASLTLALSTWLPGRVFQGNWPEMYYAATPWLAALYLRAKTRPRYAVALGVVLGLILPQARLGWVALVLFVGVFGLFDGVGRRGFRADVAWVLAVAGVTAVAVAAVKLVPAWGLLRHGLPLQAARDLYAGQAIVGLHWSRLLSGMVSPEIDIVKGQSLEICIGYVGVLWAVVGLLACWRASWRVACVWAVFAWLVMAWRAPFDLFHYLHSLPVLGAMTSPTRDFNFFLVFCLAAAAGVGVARLRRVRRLRWLVPILCAASTAEVFHASMSYHRFQFTKPAPTSDRADSFHQLYCLVRPRWAPRPLAGNAYFNILRGVGTVNYHTSLALPEFVQPKWFVDRFGRSHPNSRYRGEAHASAAGSPVQIRFPRPNRIAFRVTLPAPDVVVINQNYAPGWRTSLGEVMAQEGLLAVRLPAGEHEVELRYTSRLFWAGAAISLTALALAGLLVWSRGRRVRRAAAYARVAARRLRLGPVRAACAALVVLGVLAAVLHPRIRADQLVARASRHMAMGQYHPAAGLLHEAARARPRDAGVLRRLGTCLARTGRVAEGLDALRQGVAAAPSDGNAGMALLGCLASAGNVESALAEARRMRQRFPLLWEVHFWEAVCWCRQARLDHCEAALFRAIELGLDDELALRNAPALAPLRSTPAFERLVQALRARHDRD